MKKIERLWEELKFPETWSNEEIINKINQLIEWTYEHDNRLTERGDEKR